MKYLLAMVLLCSFGLEAKAAEAKKYTKNVTLVGLEEGIMIHTRKRPVIVKGLHSDSKGWYYSQKDVLFIPKGFMGIFGHKKKKHEKHYCYCIVCQPTTMYEDQGVFVGHMKAKVHVKPVQVKK
jgi:hypothetical protein